MTSLEIAGNHVVDAVDELVRVLDPTIKMDWQILTPSLIWTQEQTAIHTMRACLEYSYQVVGGRMDTYQPVLFEKKEHASPADILKMISTAGRVLEKVVKTSSINDRAWHSYGISDPIGFAAMGVVEVSVHTYDLAKGFGMDFVPPKQLADFAIERLFQGTVEFPEVSDSDAGKLLLWCAGRIELVGFAQRQGWKWNGQVR
jgi:hypothetical protein